MPCYRPLTAWQLDGGEIVFAERGRVRRQLELPCGRCIGCRSTRARAWALRCMHESQMHAGSSFVTLTYDDEHFSPSLNYLDFQLFMKRVRSKLGATRFFMCGEYGSEQRRPHFHALLFGRQFDDVAPVGANLWRSPVLEELWPYGFSSIGEVTFESASYVSQYVVKKCNGVVADQRYKRVDLCTGEIISVSPEFGHMSLKPGIGYTWFERYWRDCYMARDGVVLKGGRTVPNPRYYDKLLDELDYSLKDSKDLQRYLNSKKFASDGTPERLAVREHVHKARVAFYNRSKL